MNKISLTKYYHIQAYGNIVEVNITCQQLHKIYNRSGESLSPKCFLGRFGEIREKYPLQSKKLPAATSLTEPVFIKYILFTIEKSF